MHSDTREEFASRFGRYSKHGAQFAKAIDAAFEGCVKKHLFLPSGRAVYTVVGKNGDEFIDPEKLVCSCESYFYRVLGGRSRLCYHMLSYEIASESGLVKETRFDDEEYDTFMRLLALDIVKTRRRSRPSAASADPNDHHKQKEDKPSTTLSNLGLGSSAW
jgi:predicted nucleic acid-binding Zn finger protein